MHIIDYRTIAFIAKAGYTSRTVIPQTRLAFKPLYKYLYSIYAQYYTFIILLSENSFCAFAAKEMFRWLSRVRKTTVAPARFGPSFQNLLVSQKRTQ